MSRTCTAVLLAVLGALTAPAATALADDAPPKLIVAYDDGASRADRAQVNAATGADAVSGVANPVSTTRLLTLDGATSDAQAARLADRVDAMPGVRYAELDGQLQAATNDPYWSLEWGWQNVGQVVGGAGLAGADASIPAAWTVTQGQGATVGTLDTGMEATHPDLVGASTGAGWDYVNNDANPTDDNNHGTHVAGIIAARAGNGIGVAGVAPQAQITPVKVLGANGSGTWTAFAAGFTRLAQQGVRVVNASLGGGGYSQYIADTVAAYPNTLLVVAAGNDALNLDTTQETPCSLQVANVLCVGASTNLDTRASFSNYGTRDVDIFAPGQTIVSTVTHGGYAYMSGTSMASPVVAGVAALLAAADPGLSAAQIKSAILASADHPGGLAGLSVTGGRVDARAALDEVAGSPVIEAFSATPARHQVAVSVTVHARSQDAPVVVAYGPASDPTRYEAPLGTVPAGTEQTLTQTIGDLPPGATVLRAEVAGVWTSEPQTVTVTGDAPALGALTTLGVTDSTASVAGDVVAGDDDASWTLEVSGDGGSSWSHVADGRVPAGATTSVRGTAVGLTSDQDYTLRLRATSSDGSAEQTAVAHTAGAAPAPSPTDPAPAPSPTPSPDARGIAIELNDRGEVRVTLTGPAPERGWQLQGAWSTTDATPTRGWSAIAALRALRLSSGARDGTYWVNARLVDRRGNVVAHAQAGPVTIDRSAPVVRSVAATQDSARRVSLSTTLDDAAGRVATASATARVGSRTVTFRVQRTSATAVTLISPASLPARTSLRVVLTTADDKDNRRSRTLSVTLGATPDATPRVALG